MNELVVDSPTILAGDVGGTSIRLGIFRGNEEIFYRRYPTREFGSLSAAVESFILETKLSPRAGVIGVPGPVREGEAKTTNVPWSLCERELSEDFPIRLYNDLELLAQSVPHLDKSQFVDLQSNAEIIDSVGIVAPGTGLGQSALIKKNDEWLSIESEGGHVNFAPANHTEWDLFLYLGQTLKRVSVERVLSGPGLYNIFRFFVNRYLGHSSIEQIALLNRVHAQDRPVAYITDEARRCWELTYPSKQEQVFRDTVRMMISILGSHAGNVALSINAQAVYLGGGIPGKIIDLIKASNILESFVNKGRLSYLLREGTLRVITGDRPALLGGVHMAKKLLKL